MRLIRAGTADESAILAALDRSILVSLPREATWRHQLLALTLTDLLGRVFPRIGFENAEVAASEHLPPGDERLIDRLEAIRYHGRVSPVAPGEPEIVIRIGASNEGADVYVDGYGWQAFIGSTPSKLPTDRGALVAVGPLVAACRGAARIFSIAMAGFRPPLPRIESTYWSGLTYVTSNSPFNEPVPTPDFVDGALLGAGSVGGAACYLWCHSPGLRGTLELIDPESLDPKNPDKALLASKLASEQQLVKVNVAEAALAHHAALAVTAHSVPLSDWVASRRAKDPLPLMMCAVDSIEARRELQDSLPLEVINAACNTDEIAVSGHRTGEGPCVYCMHLPQVLDRDRILAKLIAKETGVDFMSVVKMLVQDERLSASLLRRIEGNRGLNVGSLAPYEGRSIDEMYRSEFLYGEARLRLDGGTEAAVPAPFVTALAGFLLAAEALKAGADTPLGRFRLGPRGEVGIKVAESPYQDPANRIISLPLRWPSHECLCRSSRRLRLIEQRYGASA